MSISWLSLVLACVFLFLAIRSFKNILRLKLLHYGHETGVLVFAGELVFFVMLIMFVLTLSDFVRSTPLWVHVGG